MHCLVPELGEVSPEAITESLGSTKSQTPFSDLVIEFSAALSSSLMRHPRVGAYPELRALGFWMRKAELLRLRGEFESLHGADHILVPRGLVFHVPPANVDTIFIYSWLLALLTGNRNVVRISTRESEVVDVLCAVINNLFETDKYREIRSGTCFVRYGHEREVTSAFSAIADVRVLWGGDNTVNELRTVPISPHAQELTFPDRWSLAVVQAEQWLQLDNAGREALATQFFNDSYWFDQMACSSPRLVAFCGQTEACRQAQEGFFAALAEIVRSRDVRWETAVVLDKLLHAYRAAIDQPVERVRALGNALTVIQLGDVRQFPREHPGGGLFYSACVNRLSDLASLISRRDQTMTAFGFNTEEIRELVMLLNGKGVDRVVPIGQALSFHRFWDGYDLLHGLTRLVHIDPGTRQLPVG